MKIVTPNLNFKDKLTPLNLSKVKYIVVHHIAAETATVETIDKWHKDRGWNGIGYNEYIRKDGTVYVCRGDNIGAHAEGYNKISYGVALEGNFDKEVTMSKQQRDSLIERLKYHRNRMNKDVVIVQHKEKNRTTCPGQYFPFLEILQAVTSNEISNTDDALDVFIKHNIINSPEYWQKVLDTTKYFDILLIDTANALINK